MSKQAQQVASTEQSKPLMFEVDPYYHLVPIINLARLAIMAEKNLNDMEFVARAMPAVGDTLHSAGVYGVEESLAEDAAKALAFVTYVLQAKHEAEMEGGRNGT